MITYSKIYNVMERLREKEKDILQNGKSSLCSQSRNNKIDNLIFEKLADLALRKNINDIEDSDKATTLKKAIYNFIKEEVFYATETIENYTIVEVYPLITLDMRKRFKDSTGCEFPVIQRTAKITELGTNYIFAFQYAVESEDYQYRDTVFANYIGIVENILQQNTEIRFVSGRNFTIAAFIASSLLLNCSNTIAYKELKKWMLDKFRNVGSRAIMQLDMVYRKLFTDEETFDKILLNSRAYCNIGQFFDKEDIAYYCV